MSDNTTKVDLTRFPKQPKDVDDNVTKVDLTKKPEDDGEGEKPKEGDEAANPTPGDGVDGGGVANSDASTTAPPEPEKVSPEGEAQKEPVIKEPEITLPEGIEKIVEFMNETGGTIEDFVRLNEDVTALDDSEVLERYYEETKPYLTPEERRALMDSEFRYDEEEDSPSEIQMKKIALKERVAAARKYLSDQKEKYYTEVKAQAPKPVLDEKQQEAIDFFNRYQETSKERTQAFRQKTDEVFGSEFKGFDFKIGDDNFTVEVSDVAATKEQQLDLNNLMKKFVNADGVVEDAAGYHKALFAAMNPELLAKHFYEQGKADGIKENVARGRNIDTTGRATHNVVEANGIKVRPLGDDSGRLKIKNKYKQP